MLIINQAHFVGKHFQKDLLLNSTLLLLRMLLMVMFMLYKYAGYLLALILTYIYVCLSSLTIIVFNVIMPMPTYIHMTVANVKACFLLVSLYIVSY